MLQTTDLSTKAARTLEERADRGGALLARYNVTEENVNPVRFDAFTDMLTDVAHCCARFGLVPADVFEASLRTYEKENTPGGYGSYWPTTNRAKPRKRWFF